jgi:hypothetical protein
MRILHRVVSVLGVTAGSWVSLPMRLTELMLLM